MKYKFFILIAILLLISCSDSSSENSKNTFQKAINNYTNCQTEYEIKYKHKPIIDIRNSTHITGLAKDVADFLRENCYNTYYGNWNSHTSDINTYIIIDNVTESSLNMINELKKILNFDFKMGYNISVRYPECDDIELTDCIENYSNSSSDITLIIGEDYQK
tara:strand:+ start:487 stop:972 length:486 start_codon:yes stop_codon:yes gene_type:complete